MEKVRKKENLSLPRIIDLEKELSRERRKNNTFALWTKLLLSISVLIVLVVVVFFSVMPVLRIYGSSMSPTLNNDDMVITARGSDFKTGDILAFYYNNKILVKRCIACPGDWVDMDNDGNVSVNGERLSETYVMNKEKGDCDLTFPLQIPDGRYFVLGDNRGISLDSRNRDIGCIADEHILGKVVFRLLPFGSVGKTK